MFNCSVPIPSIGESTPPNTWYLPLYSLVFSRAITSRASATTQIVLRSRLELRQISQVGWADKLKHTEHKPICCLASTKA